jgi:hypothetical protein
VLFAYQFLAFQFSLGDIPSALFWVACWLLGLTALMSFVEHQVHRKLMHRKGFLTQRFAALETAFQRHAVLHHGQYSKVFHDQPVDYGTDRGIQLSMREGFIESLPFLICRGDYFPLYRVRPSLHLESNSLGNAQAGRSLFCPLAGL